MRDIFRYGTEYKTVETNMSINSKISFWEYSFIMNKRNQRPADMFNKQDVTVYLTYIKTLKD